MKLIGCLKKTGMSLDDMRPFLHLSADELISSPEMYARVVRHRDGIEAQIAQLQQTLQFIDLKLQEGFVERAACDSAGADPAAPASAASPWSSKGKARRAAP